MTVDRVDRVRDELRATLDAADLAPRWDLQLAAWLAEATAAELAEPTAMVLASVDLDGSPSTRSVLCKGIDTRGIVFYTNYTSAKSRDLRSNQRASVTFPWYALQRQVNVRGTVERASREETARYWATRARGSQLGAWASPQSVVMSSRQALEDSLDAVTRRFSDSELVPVPPHWGGWLLRPDRVEFWQGRKDRMHDRLTYDRTPDQRWTIHRLAP
ncbi:MAG: pyridoxamine 5-phosphate oxidase [Pseudonocardiales bacterium]|jgi:pyridoxamine 5'-phosphate oxidase|nr:Pyridoxamine 5-phosphate oxidase [Pseudonocardia sp.]MDT7561840.1 pyridoxamine 5-phosphate oxidase [Pseudonocardiales bacterium]MDT7585846.1 pyridoxamine 5-phosphate oxidase [Pseudonocardiales bacterium]MDT7622864.1 pyridoxamine 5-phosphate oxidase [Pseudonocardiales bacterium]MDT7628637.1 pyridoxamine 5-phosphate oxidase [Pseudonocardiales bacterium]